MVRHVLRNVHRCATVLSAERQALQNSDAQQRDWCEPSRGLVCWQQSDDCCRSTHDRQGHKECILAPDQVADSSKEEGTKRPHDESYSERRKVGDVGKRLVSSGIEYRGQYRGETSENIEVIPLDHRADSGGKNHSPDAVFGGTAHGDRVCTAGHASSCELRPSRDSAWPWPVAPWSATARHTSL